MRDTSERLPVGYNYSQRSYKQNAPLLTRKKVVYLAILSKCRLISFGIANYKHKLTRMVCLFRGKEKGRDGRKE